MFPIVELPEIVKHYTAWFAPVFSDEALIQFQRYITGLIVSENKTVEGINRLIVHESRNQSSLNRLLTASPYSHRDAQSATTGLVSQFAGYPDEKERGLES